MDNQASDLDERPQNGNLSRRGNPDWKPGRSGNPAGRRYPKDRIATIAVELTAEFIRLHNRVPSVMERRTITSAATLSYNIDRCPKDPATTKRINTLRRHLHDLGMSKLKVPPAAPTSPFPSAAEMMAANKARAK
jgi:hypothetical protein